MKRKVMLFCSLFVGVLTAGTVYAGIPPELEQDFQSLKTYTQGGDFSACQRIIDAVTAVRNDPAKAAPLAERMAQALSETGYDGKWFLCQWLYVIGTEREAAALGRLVHDRKTAPLGLYALRAIPGKGVDQELIRLLRSTRDPYLLCGILDCLGKRGVTESLGYVAPLMRGGNALVVRAAAQALADMATAEAIYALQDALKRTRPPRDALIADALIRACSRCKDAAAVEAGLSAVEQQGRLPQPLQVAARSVRMERAVPEAREALLYAMLVDSNPEIRKAGMTLVPRLEGKEVTLAAARAMADSSAENRRKLLALLEQRADEEAYPYVYGVFTGSADPEERAALIRTLGVVGDYRTAPDFLTLLEKTDTPDPVKVAVLDALRRMKDSMLDGYLVSRLDSLASPARIQVIGVLAARRTPEAIPELFKWAASSDRESAAAAVTALGELVSDPEFPRLAGLLEGGFNGDADKLEAALMSALRRMDDMDRAARALMNALREARDPAYRAAAMRALGQTGSPVALPALYREASRGKQVARLAAITSLGKWKSPEPLEKLRKWAVSGTKTKNAVRETAVGALLELLKTGNVPPETALSVYRDLLKASRGNDGMTKQVLAGSASLAHPAGVDLVLPYLEDERYAAEAAAALGRILLGTANLSASTQPEICRNAVDGDPRSRWSTGKHQKPGMWFQFDFGRPVPLSGIVLDTSRTPTDFPRGLEVYVFDDPERPGEPVASVAESDCTPSLTVKFPERKGRLLRLVLTGTTDKPAWSIHEVRLLTRTVGQAAQTAAAGG